MSQPNLLIPVSAPWTSRGGQPAYRIFLVTGDVFVQAGDNKAAKLTISISFYQFKGECSLPEFSQCFIEKILVPGN